MTATLQSTGDGPVQFTAVLNADGTLTSKELGGQHAWEKQAPTARVIDDCAALDGRSWLWSLAANERGSKRPSRATSR